MPSKKANKEKEKRERAARQQMGVNQSYNMRSTGLYRPIGHQPSRSFHYSRHFPQAGYAPPQGYSPYAGGYYPPVAPQMYPQPAPYQYYQPPPPPMVQPQAMPLTPVYPITAYDPYQAQWGGGAGYWNPYYQ